MKDVKKPFFSMPAKEITRFLSVSDINSLGLSSKTYSHLFKSQLNISQLLQYVVQGDDDSVRTILKNNWRLVLEKGKVTDNSHRTFEDITCFQYALWALDKHMWTLIMDCFPQEEQQRLYSQYQKFKHEGVTYWLDGKKIIEKHFDFKRTIIDGLDAQKKFFDNPISSKWNNIVIHWKTVVGGAQKLFPVHIVKEYCSNLPFEPLPEFINKPEVAPSIVKDWFTNELGSTIAKYKGSGVCAWDAEEPCVKVIADLEAMKKLYDIRAKEFNNLKSCLKHKTVNNQTNTVSSSMLPTGGDTLSRFT